MCRICSDAEFARSIWQRYDALATDGCTSGASSVRVFTSLTSAFRLLVTSRPTLLGISAQMHGVGVSASDYQSHLHSHRSSDSVAETVTMAASGTGMIGTGAGLSVKTAVITIKSNGASPDQRSADKLPTFSHHSLLAPMSSTSQMRYSATHPGSVHTSP